ncbi:MAG TPA: hypothetical protein PK082_04070, partial [Phycisphaerae bacterium]|nr:hypothetical protein [Phycisphaerae bacterium]
VKTAEDRAGENAVAQCVGDLRDKCTKVMFEIGLDCGREDVIANGGKGYHLRDWIAIENHDGADAGTFAGTNVPVNVPANVPATGKNVPASSRHVPVNVPATPKNVPASAADVPASVPASLGNVPASFNNRQQWALRELRKSGKLGRAAIENRFHVGEKTAKRDLSELVKGGLIEYIRNPRPGHYRLARRG